MGDKPNQNSIHSETVLIYEKQKSYWKAAYNKKTVNKDDKQRLLLCLNF